MKIKIYKDLKQGTPEWFKVRLGKLTGSTAQAVGSNGAGLKTLCLEKTAEVTTGLMKEFYTNSDMERGNELEPKAREAYERLAGCTVDEVGFIELDSRVGCSPDGLVVDSKGIIEIKCPNDAKFVKFAILRKIETGYEWQMQFNMLVSGRLWCDYIVYNPHFPVPIIVTRILRDDIKIKKLKVGIESGRIMIKNFLGIMSEL